MISSQNFDSRQSRSWQPLRPIYGLADLAARPDAPVLVVEGEKAADAAAELLPDYVAVTIHGELQSQTLSG